MLPTLKNVLQYLTFCYEQKWFKLNSVISHMAYCIRIDRNGSLLPNASLLSKILTITNSLTFILYICIINTTVCFGKSLPALTVIQHLQHLLVSPPSRALDVVEDTTGAIQILTVLRAHKRRTNTDWSMRWRRTCTKRNRNYCDKNHMHIYCLPICTPTQIWQIYHLIKIKGEKKPSLNASIYHLYKKFQTAISSKIIRTGGH